MESTALLENQGEDWPQRMEKEDDLFFADLSKQISLLIMDEDEDDVLAPPLQYSYPLQDLSYVMASEPTQQQQQLHNMQDKNYYYSMRESKGTGVFIPKCSQPRRKSARHTSHSNNSRSYHYRQHNDGRGRYSQEESKANYFIHPKKI